MTILKTKRDTIHAKAQSSGIWAIGENMAKVTITAGAAHLVTDHPMAGIAIDCNDFVGQGGPETRPAGTAVILGVAVEQVGATTGADIMTIALVHVEMAGKGALSAMLAKHMKLFGSQAFTPFGVSEV